MRSARLTWCVTALAAAAVSAGAARQQSSPPAQGRPFTPAELTAYRAALPDGPARETVIRVCGQCHEPQRPASLRLTREGWEGVVQKMKGLGATAFATDADLSQITDYLAENFKGEAARPINLNSASAIDLEAVAGLLRKEAAVWIAYRAKTPCKTLDDLKKVEGLPFDKIDQRRDRLSCF